MPKTVKASINNGVVTVEGPKGKLSQAICNDAIKVEIGETQIVVSRSNDEKATKAAHGLMRQLIRNMVIGVSEGYQKSLTIVGVGYKAELQKNILVFTTALEPIMIAGVALVVAFIAIAIMQAVMSVTNGMNIQ